LVVPTVTFRLLYVLIVMNHERRKVVHFNITDSPSAAWTAQQIVNAFPYDTAPKYLLRDRDSIYGSIFVHRVKGMGIQQKLAAPRSPWQRRNQLGRPQPSVLDAHPAHARLEPARRRSSPVRAHQQRPWIRSRSHRHRHPRATTRVERDDHHHQPRPHRARRRELLHTPLRHQPRSARDLDARDQHRRPHE
jgi:hypothetical protein